MLKGHMGLLCWMFVAAVCVARDGAEITLAHHPQKGILRRFRQQKDFLHAFRTWKVKSSLLSACFKKISQFPHLPRGAL